MSGDSQSTLKWLRIAILFIAVSPCLTLSVAIVYWAVIPPPPRYQMEFRLASPDGVLDVIGAIERENWIEEIATPGTPGPVVVVVSVVPAGTLVTHPSFRDGIVARVSAEGRPADTIRCVWASEGKLTIEVLRGDVLLLRSAALVEVEGKTRVVNIARRFLNK